MAVEKRFGMEPIPKAPEYYINKRQINGIPILEKFGWKLVCIRRPSLTEIIPILCNRDEGLVGILGEDGILRISDTLKIRRSTSRAATFH